MMRNNIYCFKSINLEWFVMCLRGQLTLNQVIYRCFTSTVILFFFLLHHMTCGILVLQPGFEVRVLTTGPPGNSFLLFLEDMCSIRFHQWFKVKDESLIEKCRMMARGSGGLPEVPEIAPQRWQVSELCVLIEWCSFPSLCNYILVIILQCVD